MTERDKFLQVRVTEEERAEVAELAGLYGLDTSTFVRALIKYATATTPTLRIEPEGKAIAPSYMSGLTPQDRVDAF
jgi:antitoxin component of RelBE/YafQ-DinJ toxin-antitoxin module